MGLPAKRRDVRQTGQRWILSMALGVVAAWNLWVLAGYLLSGLSMFLLVRRLTRSPPAALIAGWAFAFFPFADIRGGAHVDFIQAWSLVILVWRMLELRISSTRRNGLLVAAALSLCILLNPYFWLFAGAAVGTLLVVDLVGAARTKQLLTHARSWAWALSPPILLMMFLEAVNLTYSAGATDSEQRDLGCDPVLGAAARLPDPDPWIGAASVERLRE